MNIKEFKSLLTKSEFTSKEVLEILAKDEDWEVRECVEILKILAKDKHLLVRISVAKNPNTPKDILEILAKDENFYVRESVAKNPNTPKEILEILAKDEKSFDFKRDS